MFPAYRKLENNKVYYKIHSENEFEEIILLGKYYFINKVVATQYPEKLRISDMIDGNKNTYLVISETDYKAFQEECFKNYIRKSF